MALSANVMQGEPERCLAAGMDDFAGKPTTIPLLATKLQEWLPQLTSDSTSIDPMVDVRADTGADDGGPLDRTVLAELTAGDSALFATVLRDYVESSRADMCRLDAAVEAHDLGEVRHQAHRLKGASGAVGAKRVAIVAGRIEMKAGDTAADGDDLRILAADATAELARVAEELDN